jgi:hypothetical protein
LGSTSEYAGWSKTSSNVKPWIMSLGACIAHFSYRMVGKILIEHAIPAQPVKSNKIDGAATVPPGVVAASSGSVGDEAGVGFQPENQPGQQAD